MHALILSGSRNVEGLTARCANAIVKGLSKTGVSSEIVFLPTLKIERCRQCESDGWGICRREGRCIIEDDFAMLVKKIQSSEIIVFTNPVYFSDLSESMRAFLDRLRRTTFPQNKQMLKGKNTFGVCLAGGGGSGAPSACFMLERILRTIGFQVVDVMPVKRQNIDKKIPILEITGEWLAKRTDARPSAYGIRLADLARRIYIVFVYLIYVLLGRWRHKRV
jgi:multimeric flavodoxin WrbA